MKIVEGWFDKGKIKVLLDRTVTDSCGNTYNIGNSRYFVYSFLRNEETQEFEPIELFGPTIFNPYCFVSVLACPGYYKFKIVGAW